LAVVPRQDEQVLPLVPDVGVPVAVEQPREHLCLDGGFGGVVHPLLFWLVGLLEGVLGGFGGEGGGEGGVVAVGRPQAGGRLGADGRELAGLAAVQGDGPELVVAAAVGLEEEVPAVGRPARVAVLLAGDVGELPRRALVGRDQPDAGG